MTPPLKAEDLVGLVRVHVMLCKAFVPDSDDCAAVPTVDKQSNAFFVGY